jgi:hypothetical protein
MRLAWVVAVPRGIKLKRLHNPNLNLRIAQTPTRALVYCKNWQRRI